MATCRLVECPFCCDDSDDPRCRINSCYVCRRQGYLVVCSECYLFGILKELKDNLFKITKGCEHLKLIIYCKSCKLLCNQNEKYLCEHIEQINRCRHCNYFDSTLYQADRKFVCGDCRDKHSYKCCEYSDCTRLTQGECELCDAPVCSEHQWCDDCE